MYDHQTGPFWFEDYLKKTFVEVYNNLLLLPSDQGS